MTPADLSWLLRGLELLVNLVVSGITTANASEEERQKMLAELEMALDARAARIAALRPISSRPTPPVPSPLGE